MKNVIDTSYFMYGSQYYRAPSPHRNEWEQDIKNMANYGFTMIKYWIQWRWNNPKEGVYYWDDIDELMDLAKKYKIKVMLNTIFDVAPAWIYTKYSDASMITLGGKVIGPQTQPHRQIGGLGYCFNNDNVTKHQFEFLSEAIKRYQNHPALEIWNVGSEPELTSSMAEMRLYADDAEKINDMLCYCNNCKSKFRNWLHKKYGSLTQLNIAWNRNYQSFDEVELPKTRNTFNDIIDWRMFFVHTIGENVKKRFEITKSIDADKHLLMCHHVFIQGFPVTSTANDPWNVGKNGDLHGFTQMDDAMMIDVLRSCAKGKPVVSAEMLMLMGYTLDMPKYIDENDIKRHIFSGIAGNLKGFIFWQYRQEILGREAPTWGLTYLDGSETPWLKSFAKIGKALQKNNDFLHRAAPEAAKVAMLYNPENQVFVWASTGNEKNATNSMLGYHKALYSNNYNVDFVHQNEIVSGILNNYKVLVCPFSYAINKQCADAIEQWVKAGGVIISESYFAAWNMENGHHEKTVPGYNLHKVFKAKQGLVEPANYDKVIRINLTRDSSYLRKEEEIIGGITNEIIAVSDSLSHDEYGVTIKLKKNICALFKDSLIKGKFVKETLIPEGAEVLAEFDTGEPAITLSNYGKGKAILIGSYVGLPCFGYDNNVALIANLVDYAAQLDKPLVEGSGKIRVDVLSDKKDHMVILRNLTDDHISASISINVKGIKNLKEIFDGNFLEVVGTGDKSIVFVKMNPKDVKVYRD